MACASPPKQSIKELQYNNPILHVTSQVNSVWFMQLHRAKESIYLTYLQPTSHNVHPVFLNATGLIPIKTEGTKADKTDTHTCHKSIQKFITAPDTEAEELEV